MRRAARLVPSLLAATALLAPCARGGQQPEPRDEPAVEERPAVLDRDPASLPRAEAGAWSGWTPEDAPPAAVERDLVAAARAYGSGDVPATMRALYAVLERRPGYPPALHQLGVIHFRLRRYGDARECFERYLGVAPERVADTRALAHCLYSLGEYEAARDHYRRVIEAGEDSPQATFGLALCLARLGEEESALELLRGVAERDPRHVEARTWIAQLAFDAGELEVARDASESAAQIDPFAPRPWYLLARIRFELGEDEAAEEARARFEVLARVDAEVRTLEARLYVHPRDTRVLARLTELHRQTGDVAALHRVFERWLPLAPDDVRLRVFALDVLAELGDRDGAAVAAGELERAAGDDIEAWRRLARHFAWTRQRVKQIAAEDRVRELSRDG